MRIHWLLMAVIGLITIALVFNIRWAWGSDDIAYRDFNQQFNGQVIPFLQMRSETWTSRLTIEAAIFAVVNHLFWWRLITALAFWLVIVLPPLFVSNNPAKLRYLLPVSGLLVLSIPSGVWFDAGLIATSINYLWALAAGLLAALPVVWFLQNRPFNWWWLLAAIPAALFAGGSEIVSVLLAALYATAIGLLIYRRQFNRPASLVAGGFQIFLLAAVLWHVLSPGNAARGGSTDWFSPLFPIIFEASFSSTLRQLFMSGYLVPLAFFIVIVCLNYQRRGWGLFTYLSLVPIAGSLLLRDPYPYVGTMGTLFTNLFIDGNLLWNTTEPGLPQTFYLSNLLAVFVLTLLLLTAIAGIVGAFMNRPQLVPILVILAAGFASKFIVVQTIGHALAIQFHRTDLYLLVAFALATLISIAAPAARVAEAQASGVVSEPVLVSGDFAG